MVIKLSDYLFSARAAFVTYLYFGRAGDARAFRNRNRRFVCVNLLYSKVKPHIFYALNVQ